MLNISLVGDAYQYALRVEEKLKRKNQGSSQGKEKQDYSTKAKLSAEDEPKPVGQKRRIGRCDFKGTCFRCYEEGHRSYELLQKDGDLKNLLL